VKAHSPISDQLAPALAMSVNLSPMTSYRGLSQLLIAASVHFGLPATAVPSEQPVVRIELYTMGPGDYLFSKFGHAALCVVDPEGREGRCFNYGTADFSTPGPLTWAVMRGRAEFWVSVASLDDMLRQYRAEDRTIYRQVLPLDGHETAELKRALATNALSENRSYQYDHFLDNCSTRPRDLIDRATAGALRAVPGSSVDDSFTFRALIRQNLENEPFYFLLTEIFLGRPMDRARSEFEAMFLPHVLRDAVRKHLQVAPEVVYARRASIRSRPPLVLAHRLAMALGVGIAGGLTILMSSPQVSSRLQSLFACLFGTLGCTVWALAILSPLPELRYNEILLVFLPTDFFLLLGSTRVTFHASISASIYAGIRVAGLILVALLLLSGVLIQPLGAVLALTLPVFSATWARALAPSPQAR
jgi:hypothetical protein